MIMPFLIYHVYIYHGGTYVKIENSNIQPIYVFGWCQTLYIKTNLPVNNTLEFLFA